MNPISAAFAGREVRALAAIIALWELSSYRYKGDLNNLRFGWGVTFGGDVMPDAPTLSLKHKKKIYNVYIDAEATSVTAVLRRLRIVVLKPGNQFELRALDIDSMLRVMGKSSEHMAESLLKHLGITLHEVDPDKRNGRTPGKRAP